MRLVQAHPADLVILAEQHHDLVRQLQHLHGHMLEQERHGLGPALVRRARIGHAGERKLALLLHDIRRPGLQDRIGVVADQLAVVAHAVVLPPRPLVTGPGPDAGGMSQGRDPCRQMPEKSGTDAAPCAAIAAGATAGAAVCPKTGFATAVAKVTKESNKRKSRCIAMATSLSGSPIASRVQAHSISSAATARGMPRLWGPDLCRNGEDLRVARTPATC